MKVKTNGNIICFNFEADKYAALSNICGKLEIRIHEVPKEDFGKSVGELMGFQVDSDSNTRNVDFPEEMMVVYNLGNSLDKLLKNMRSAELNVPYKAMLTGTNQSWLPKDLILELIDEHEQMNKDK